MAQLALYLDRVLASVCNSQASGDADAVRIADIGGLMVDIAQDQIGGFSTYARQGDQVFHCPGNFPVIVGDKPLRAGNHVPGFAIVKAAGVNVSSDLGRIGFREAFQCGKTVKQGGSDLIDPRISALGA